MKTKAVKTTRTIIAISLIVFGFCQSFDFYYNVFKGDNSRSELKQANNNSIIKQEVQ